jgi:hypothetical protein
MRNIRKSRRPFINLVGAQPHSIPAKNGNIATAARRASALASKLRLVVAFIWKWNKNSLCLCINAHSISE